MKNKKIFASVLVLVIFIIISIATSPLPVSKELNATSTVEGSNLRIVNYDSFDYIDVCGEIDIEDSCCRYTYRDDKGDRISFNIPAGTSILLPLESFKTRHGEIISPTSSVRIFILFYDYSSNVLGSCSSEIFY
ncbi:MAG: hypothetical protein GY756_05555 [bacterium]|nr:hypothetical protein [bacterium]